MKDSQRRAVYDAHEALCPEGLVFRSHDEVERFIRLIVSTRWWKMNSPIHDVAVTLAPYEYDWNYARRMEDRTAVLSITRKSRYEIIVYHELAHILTPEHAAPHGPAFCRDWVRLVRRFNPRMAGRLLEELADRGAVVR